MAKDAIVSTALNTGTFVRDQSYPRGAGADLATPAASAIDLSFNYPSVVEQTDLLSTHNKAADMLVHPFFSPGCGASCSAAGAT